ncbi:TlpA family protein disulfide reductase [Saccharicrinis sp. FJH54]|uniref:TlpA family protein disulfide reductase n=1 Tax=Saccharicrinis sp. FJH54 TaxID=3344665 RepID=UPI0035D464C3
MKGFAILLLSCVVFVACQDSYKKSEIKGHFVGYIPNEVRYSVPVNGVCYEFFNTVTNVDSSGNFKIENDTKSPCFTTLFLKEGRGQFILEPNENYGIDIESKGYSNRYEYTCKSRKVQEAYQNLVSPLHPQVEAMNFLSLPIEMAYHNIGLKLKQDIEVFEKLLNNDEISKETLDLIKLDRAIFYNSVLGYVATLKFVRIKRRDLEANADSITQVWGKAITGIPLNTESFLKSKWAYYFIENYLLYKEYTQKDYNWDSRKTAREEDKIHTYLMGVAKNYLNDKVLEFYTASYIITAAKLKKFEKELIDLFENFKADFPESNYTRFLTPEIEKIREFYQVAEKKPDDSIIFLNNYEKLNSLSQILLPFKGKKVYVDIWSTSCSPCKDDFEFKKDLNDLLKSKKIEMLYISLTGDNKEQKWKDMIKYYNLTGYHIRANKELKADLEHILGSYWIPRYLLIDENGNIISNDAKRPSELKDLEKQIHELL